MTTMTPAELDALEALLRERAETLRDDLGYAAAVMDVCAADAIRSLRAELADELADATNTIANLQTITRAALNQVAERDARIATALVALHRRELWVDTFDALDTILSWDRTR